MRRSTPRRLLLIQPHAPVHTLAGRCPDRVAPLGLAYLAAYTPADWQVRIMDEQVQQVDELPEADLVGIGATTHTVCRAYELAAHYRRRQVPVVLGGVHASCCPDEAARFVDAVVVGDGEPVWPQLLEDARAGRLRPLYRVDPPPGLQGLRRPRRELLAGSYRFAPVSTSRGCSLRCDFCAVSTVSGARRRCRPVDEVLAELCDLPHPQPLFTDGNLYGRGAADRERFLELCRGMRRLRAQGRMECARWSCHASLDLLDDDEALAVARRAGCRVLSVGFESADVASLRSMNKSVNVRLGPESYPALIARAHRHGLLVVGELVVGSDGDTPEGLAATARFLREGRLDLLRMQVLQPFPGTEMTARLLREGRLLLQQLPEDWARLAQDFTLGVHFRPLSLEPDELQRYVLRVTGEFYSAPALARRTARIALRSRSPVPALEVLLNSLQIRPSYSRRGAAASETLS